MKTIRIVSPAKAIEQSAINKAVDLLKKRGFNVVLGKHVTGRHHYFSGTLAERLADFQTALDDENTDVILCARGGYGCVQLLENLDFSKFLNRPKIIAGYSDVTVFHLHIQRHYQLPTLHCTAPLNFEENSYEAINTLCRAIDGSSLRYELPSRAFNQVGEAEGEMIGGNLAIITALNGTDSDPNFRGKILFIEEVGEAIYAVDRMLYTLKKTGKLQQISGLIVGGMTSMKDSEVPFGKSVEAVIHDHVKKLDIPVCFNFPAGHIDDNRALFMGKTTTLKVKEKGAIITQ